MSHTDDQPDVNLFCSRCSTQLQRGQASFYVVRIEAFADPSPPNEGSCDAGQESLSDLIEQMQDQSERELMDQVYRTMTIHLCNQCYGGWIENPTGSLT